MLDGIRHVVRVLRVASRAAEKRVGLSAAQLFALQQLAGGQPLSLGQLASRTFTDQSSISVVITRLVRRRLVSRRRAGDDRRRIELSLTPAGRSLLRRAPAAAQEQIIEALLRLPVKIRKELATSLTRLAGELGAGKEPAAMLFEESTKAKRR